jgi:carbonic anhydrase/acetyltransferase-like protein (isoleucine patch superfamily)
VNKVTIGEHSSIGDRAVVHVAKIQGDFSTTIGNHVTIGPCVIIHACTLQDHVIIGATAQVLDGSIVESHSMVAAGSVVTPGTVVASGELWAGSPAKKVRVLTEDEKASIAATATDQAELAMMHAFENSKDYQQLSADEEELRDAEERADDYIQPKLWKDVDDVQGQGQPGFIFNSTLTHPEEGLKLMQQQQNKENKEQKM